VSQKDAVGSAAGSAETPAEVEAQVRRWLERGVIGLNLCPYAKAPYVRQQVRMVVSQARHLDGFLDDLDAELLRLRDTPPEELETTLLVHPTLFPDFFVFNDFLNVVDEVLQEHELEGEIQVAPFHPDFVFDGEPPEDMSHYTNRAPYAVLHLLREASVERATQTGDSAEAIVARNLATLRQLGLDGWSRLMKS